ncbi:MAG: sigma-70 family RNA polymerase sigma factor [Verrucomicrobiales bacterium]|nr:sigma-70 family RNA polymerase sigma factor [Verrucomicrobiales bacterium]
MIPPSDDLETHPDRGPEFRTTHWSVVLAVGDGESPEANQALESLCRTYWYPLYAFIRRGGKTPADAEDLTQTFLARMLAKRYLGLADPARGRFRTFLLCALKRFLADEWDKSRAAKRGGGAIPLSLDELEPEARYALEPSDTRSAEAIYDHQWGQSVLDHVLARLRTEFETEGKSDLFETLKTYLVGDKGDLSIAQASARLHLSEAAVKSSIHRLRSRYREMVRIVVGETVQDPGDIDREIRELLAALAR